MSDLLRSIYKFIYLIVYIDSAYVRGSLRGVVRLNKSGLTFGRYLRDTWLPFLVQRSSGARSPRTVVSYEKRCAGG
jgi:hypothetical protein